MSGLEGVDSRIAGRYNVYDAWSRCGPWFVAPAKTTSQRERQRASNELFLCEARRCPVALDLPNIDHLRQNVSLLLARGALDVALDQHRYDDCLFAEEVLVTVLRGIERTPGYKIGEARPRLEGIEPFQNHLVDRGSQAGGEVFGVSV